MFLGSTWYVFYRSRAEIKTVEYPWPTRFRAEPGELRIRVYKSIRPNDKIIKRSKGRLVAKLTGTPHKNPCSTWVVRHKLHIDYVPVRRRPGRNFRPNGLLVRENFATTNPGDKLLPTSIVHSSNRHSGIYHVTAGRYIIHEYRYTHVFSFPPSCIITVTTVTTLAIVTSNTTAVAGMVFRTIRRPTRFTPSSCVRNNNINVYG